MANKKLQPLYNSLHIDPMNLKNKQALNAISVIALVLLSNIAGAQSSNFVDAEQDENTSLTQSSTKLGTGAAQDGTAVDLFHGKLFVTLPVYENDHENIKINITYDASGIKVNQDASSVGLGWSLDVGGEITREVRGYPDDVDPERINNAHKYANKGWLTDLSNANRNSVFVDGFDKNVPSINATTMDLYERFSTWHGTSFFPDLEPDIFSYRFAGHKGYFFFDKAGIPKTIPYADISISYDIASKTGINAGISEFTIKDEGGNTFVFRPCRNDDGNYSGATFKASPAVSCVSTIFGLPQHYYPIKWYLYKVVALNGDEVNYEYELECSNLRKMLQCSARDCPSNFIFTNNQMQSHYSYVYKEGSLFGYRIKNITSRNTKVSFEYNLQRTDLVSSTSCSNAPAALTDVFIYGLQRDAFGAVTSTQLRAQKRLSYSYFGVNSALIGSPFGTTAQYNGGSSPNGAFYGSAETRLRLDELQIINTGTGAKESSFTLSYNGSQLPPKGTSEQDLWGYYNANGSNTLYPKLWVYPNETSINRYRTFPLPNYSGTEYFFDGANRSANAAVVATGILNQIRLPEGGTISYEYEPNEFKVDNAAIQGEGVRIKRIIRHDGINQNNDIIKTYGYSEGGSTSGVLFNMPQWAYTSNTTKYVDKVVNGSYYGPVTFVSGLNLPAASRAYYDQFMIRMSAPRQSASTFGDNFGYAVVMESVAGMGSTVHRFSTPGQYNHHNDAILSGSGTGNCIPAVQGVCNDLYAVATADRLQVMGANATSSIRTPNLAGTDFSPMARPYAPNLNYDWSRGLEFKKSFFNNNHDLIKEIATSYQLYTKRNMSENYTFGLRVEWAADNCHWECDKTPAQIDQIDVANQCFLRVLFPLISKYRLIGDVAMKPSLVTETEYLHGIAYTTSTEYQFESFRHALPTRERSTRADGKSREIRYSYSGDYEAFQANATNPDYQGLHTLYEKHVVAMPVETTQRLVHTDGSTAVTGSLYYSYFSGVPVLREAHQLRVQAPVTDFVPSIAYVNSATFKDSRYELVQRMQAYTPTLRVKQYSDATSTMGTVLYDPKNDYPVCQVANGALSAVAYTSFENYDNPNLPNGWSLSAPASLTTAKSKTGRHAGLHSSATVLGTADKVPPGQYVLSFWADHDVIAPGLGCGTSDVRVHGASTDPNGMAYYEYILDVQSLCYVYLLSNSTVSTAIDEIRLHPVGSLMTTTTYDPLVGKTSYCDASGVITRYEYDAMQRLILVRDGNNNIIQKMEYGLQVPE